MNFKELHDMEVHETISFDNYEILRVLGGWIYTYYSENGMGGFNCSSVFVPNYTPSKTEG